MRWTALVIGIVSMMVFVSACATAGSSSVEGNVSIPNSLGFGSSDDGVLVQFVSVENDSRCAEGVQCARAGEAFVVLRTTVDSDEPVENRIEMAPGGQESFEVDRFKITLLELLPDPPPVGGVDQQDYVLTLRVED